MEVCEGSDSKHTDPRLVKTHCLSWGCVTFLPGAEVEAAELVYLHEGHGVQGGDGLSGSAVSLGSESG